MILVDYELISSNRALSTSDPLNISSNRIFADFDDILGIFVGEGKQRANQIWPSPELELLTFLGFAVSSGQFGTSILNERRLELNVPGLQKFEELPPGRGSYFHSRGCLVLMLFLYIPIMYKRIQIALPKPSRLKTRVISTSQRVLA